jgi:anti-anti-sigma factor
MLVGTRVVSLNGGEYDIWRREELRSELDAIDASGNVTIDLHRTTFMDAGAVGLLLAFRRRVREIDPQARVTLKNTPPIVRRVLQLARAAELFDFTP